MESENIEELIKIIPMHKVYSNNLLAMGYNEEKRVMRVIFKNKSSYLYFNVEPEIWDIVSKAQSSGKALNEHIVKHKEKYKYIKL